ncbi:GAF domain-containing protein [Coleofasciculus sp. F4-SAH-05]|uniref:GAF domain-containing protein n=1 Tax=Coleofasciculus sp. F4-SAH-05 TaxID=3069525 RepID=UPI0032F841C2
MVVQNFDEMNFLANGNHKLPPQDKSCSTSKRAVLRLHTWCQSRVNGMIVLGRSQSYDWTIQEKQRLSEVKVVAEWCTPMLDQSVQLKSQGLLHQSFGLSDSGLCQKAWKQTPEPVAIADWANTPIETSGISRFEQAISHGVLMVPLYHTFSNGSQHLKRLGFLVVQQDQPRLWQVDDIEWIRWVATQLSELIDQHQNRFRLRSIDWR